METIRPYETSGTGKQDGGGEEAYPGPERVVGLLEEAQPELILEEQIGATAFVTAF